MCTCALCIIYAVGANVLTALQIKACLPLPYKNSASSFFLAFFVFDRQSYKALPVRQGQSGHLSTGRHANTIVLLVGTLFFLFDSLIFSSVYIPTDFSSPCERFMSFFCLSL